MALPDRALLALEHPSVDMATVVVVTVSWGLASSRWSQLDVLGQLEVGERVALYASLLGPASIALTVAGLAFAAYSAAGGPRLTLLRSFAGDRVRRQLLAAVAAPAITIACLVVAYVLDAGYEQWAARWLAIAGVLLTFLRLTRTIWIYTGMLKTVDEDKAPDPGPPSLDELPHREIVSARG